MEDDDEEGEITSLERRRRDPMSARFEVRRAWFLEDRRLFAVTGTVSAGSPRAGMTAALAQDPGAFTRPIHGVELFDRDPEDPGHAWPCLTFHCRDAERRKAWLALEWEGKTLELGW